MQYNDSMRYINNLMRNHPLSTDTEFSADRHLDKMIGDSESSPDSEIFQQFGGSDDAPTGGFPPIYICSKIEVEDDTSLLNKTDKKKREYETDKSSIKIQDIMTKRKETTPFFKLT